MAIKYKHGRYHILKDSGENIVNYFQNTIRDVKMSDGSTETIRGHILYRTPDCESAADEPDKVVECSNFSLKKGVTIAVKFTTDNSATGITLNVNGTGAFPIKRNGEIINSDFIAAGHVYMFNYNGTDWDLIGSDGAMKVVKYGDDDVKRYVTSVTGEGNNKNLEINDTVYTVGNKMYGDASKMTAKFDNPTVNKLTDYRDTYSLESGFDLSYLIRNIKVILSGLGSVAFKDTISTSDLDANFKNIATTAITQTDLYNGTDYSTSGEKALDAVVGKTLNTKIDNLETKLSNLVEYEWDSSTATLNIVTQ